MKNKTKVSNFFSKDITLMVLSVLLALVMWFFINAGSDVESNVPINNLPINIELSQEAKDDGLQVFSGDDTTASVEVSGNRLIVGSLTASDIQIIALDTNSIKTPGYYTLDLVAKKTSVRTNYNFASNVTPSTIEVYVDRYKEKSFDILDEIVYHVDTDYFNNSSLSETSVTVSGPETEVNSIDKVVVRGTMEGDVSKTTTDSFDLVFLDKNGEEIKIAMSDLSTSEVTVTMKPIPISEVNLTIDVINAPSDYPDFTLTPDKIKIAAEDSVLNSIENGKVDIGTLDFAKLANENHSLQYDITLPNGCKNLSGSTTAQVDIDLSGYSSKKITVDSFSTKNIDDKKYSVIFNSSGFEVTVCGPSDIVSGITSKDVIAQVDFTDKIDNTKGNSFSLELPFVFSFTTGFKECWVYGDYSVVVSVSKE